MILLKKQHHFFFFFGRRVQLPHDQVLVLEDRTFYRKVHSKRYRNSKFNILVNFNLALSTFTVNVIVTVNLIF